jgi:hypothetical protein
MLALIAVVAVAAVLIPGGSAGTTSKPYTATFDAGPFSGGSSQWIHVRIHNSASPQSIGSANITAAANATTPPSAFSITGVSTTDPTSSVTPLSPPSSFGSTLITLRSLGLAPGSDFDLWIRANVPCAADSYTWKIQAKQSNDFSGPPGNDFSLNAGQSNLVTTVSGSCKFSAVFAPSTVTGGASTTIGLTITNEASAQTLGSANVAVPTGFTITGAPSPMPSGSSWTGTGLQLRNLALAGGASYSTSIPVATPCTPASLSWTVTARAGGDYTGVDFVLDTATSSVSATVSGTNCKYVFLQQPKDAEVNATITGAIFNPSGAAVRVGVRNPATNALDATASANVTLTPSKNAASFTGTGPVALSGGQAQFGSLKSSSTGQFITLTASGSPFVSSDPSSVFNILSDVESCGTGCQAPTQNQGGTGLDASVSGFSAGDVIAVSLFTAADFSPPPNCGGTGTFNPIPDASGALVEYVPTGSGWTVTVTLRVDKSLIPISKGASQFDVCLGAKRVTQASCATDPTNGFTTKSGGIAPCDYAGNPLSTTPTGLYWGVIPDCPSGKKPITGPCVKSKTKNNAGDLLLTVAKPSPWDASMHGG